MRNASNFSSSKTFTRTRVQYLFFQHRHMRFLLVRHTLVDQQLITISCSQLPLQHITVFINIVKIYVYTVDSR